jgi:uncharacterized UPF0160 family protein
MSSLAAGAFTTKLSSAGLVYVHFGRRVIAELLAIDQSDPAVDVLFKKVYESFIEEVDAVDNGISVCGSKDCRQRYLSRILTSHSNEPGR